MRTIIFLLAVIVYSVSTLTCYALISDNKDTKPTQNITCTSSCIKVTITGKVAGSMYTYGCDTDGATCKDVKNGKCKSAKTNGITSNVCCCNDKDLCNSSGYFQPLIAIAFIVKTYFY